MINRFLGRHPFLAFGFERKIDHHDRVLFHDADEEDDADKRDQRKIDAANEQREQRADAGRWQCRKNRDRMNVTFVQNAEHDINHHNGRQDQQWLAR